MPIGILPSALAAILVKFRMLPVFQHKNIVKNPLIVARSMFHNSIFETRLAQHFNQNCITFTSSTTTLKLIYAAPLKIQHIGNGFLSCCHTENAAISLHLHAGQVIYFYINSS